MDFRIGNIGVSTPLSRNKSTLDIFLYPIFYFSEQVLTAFPGLSDPAVQMAQFVAEPDVRCDEIPAAFIDLKPGAEAPEEKLIQFCLGKIATFKVSRYVRFLAEWPLTPINKFKKFELREKIADELRQAGITEAPKLKART